MPGRTFLNRANPGFNDNIMGEIPHLKFELIGQWDRVNDILRKMGREVKESSIKAQLKVGTVIVTKVKKHLRDQDLGWVALDSDYQERKTKAGLNLKSLMAYKTYYNNIEVWRSGNRRLVSIGVRRGIYTRELSGKRSKLDVATIAAIHEFSSGKRIPRRQLWNPTITEIGGADGIKKIFVNSLVWHLRMAGIPVVQKRGNVSSIVLDGTSIKF
jgi:hypothetical protein